jgi:hypothetical protein
MHALWSSSLASPAVQELYDVLAQRQPGEEAFCAVCADGNWGAFQAGVGYRFHSLTAALNHIISTVWWHTAWSCDSVVCPQGRQLPPSLAALQYCHLSPALFSKLKYSPCSPFPHPVHPQTATTSSFSVSDATWRSIRAATAYPRYRKGNGCATPALRTKRRCAHRACLRCAGLPKV